VIKKTQVALLAASLFLSAPAFAQNVASVNGVQISDAQFEQMLNAAVSRGQKDTPELRGLIKDELINRELLAQAAVKQGLDKTPAAKLQWAQVRETFLVELFLVDYAKQHPISDADVKAQYDREVAQLQGADASQQYKVSIIIVPSADEAGAVIDQLKKGVSFEKLAKEKSIDRSKAQGGLVGWVLPSQINPEIGNAIKKMGKGAYSSSPIQTQAGWNIVKVDDKRAFKIPAFNDVQNQIRQNLIQQQRAQVLQTLRQEAKIN
jgi:peptidyl-prolyl cis-trans isomerase C